MKETSLLVDRYKYLDLYPCTNQELRAMDYQVTYGFKVMSSLYSFRCTAFSSTINSFNFKLFVLPHLPT